MIRNLLLSSLASAAMFAQAPASRLEFEVASIHPSANQTGNAQVSVGLHVDGAQVHINYLTMRDYIRIAYRIKDYQISGPDWIGSDHFDIDAKLPAAANRDQVADMLKSLLEDRFQLKTHRGTKDFNVYALVVGKGGPKMKETPPETDPAQAAEDKAAPVNVNVTGGAGGVNISMGRGSYFAFGDNKLEAKKLAMAPFADTLARFTDRPIVDMTELKGTYDFTLNFTPEDYRAMLIRSAINAGVVLPPEALKLLEFASGDSLFSAVQAIGLKLEPRKAPLDTVIIDSVLKMPTEN